MVVRRTIHIAPRVYILGGFTVMIDSKIQLVISSGGSMPNNSNSKNGYSLEESIFLVNDYDGVSKKN